MSENENEYNSHVGWWLKRRLFFVLFGTILALLQEWLIPLGTAGNEPLHM